MNNKGEIGMGTIILTFITILVGVIFLQTIAQQVGEVSNTITVTNQDLTFVANGTPIVLTTVKSISSVTIDNATNGAEVGATNYTIANNVVTNGAETVTITPDANGAWQYNWQINYTGQKPTYISSSGSRAVAGLITIMFALAIIAVSLYPVMKEKFN